MSQDPSIEPDEEQHRREHFRLRYPEGDRPRLYTAHGTFPVAELSEQGMRINLHLDHWGFGPELEGRIKLHDEEVEIQGRFLRHGSHEAAFQLSKGVSLRQMLNEQKHLIRQYPALYGRDSE